METNLRQGQEPTIFLDRWLVVVVVALMLFLLPSCGGGGSSGSTPLQNQPPPPPPPANPPPAEPFDTTAMLTNFADNIITRNYSSLASISRAFASTDGALANYCSAIGTTEESNSLTTAQQEWRAVMDVVQQTEMHVIGPALENGEALRQRVVSFSAGPISSCGVDQSAALVASGSDDFNISSRSLNQRGQGAIEYLLFNDELTHTCAAQVPATSDWNTLEEETRKRARCDLALLIADDSASAAELISRRWESFRDEFIAEGNTGTTLQLVTDAIFAIDLLTKDDKLGVPLGIHDDCSALSCPDSVESKYANQSLLNIRANTVAFLEIFQGGEGLGFDNLITDAGFAEVSERFVTNLNVALNALDAAQSTLYEEATAIDNEAAETACTNAFANPDGGEPDDGSHSCRITGLLKRVTDDLKIDFVTIVDVSIPGSAQSDND